MFFKGEHQPAPSAPELWESLTHLASLINPKTCRWRWETVGAGGKCVNQKREEWEAGPSAWGKTRYFALFLKHNVMHRLRNSDNIWENYSSNYRVIIREIGWFLKLCENPKLDGKMIRVERTDGGNNANDGPPGKKKLFITHIFWWVWTHHWNLLL